MKIENPFGAKYIRCKTKVDGKDWVGVFADARELELPDGCTEVLVEGLNVGRVDGEPWTNRMWVKDRGFMDVREYEQLLKIEKERKELNEQRAKDQKRKEKEARERGKVKKVVSEKVDNKIDAKLDLGKELEL